MSNIKTIITRRVDYKELNLWVTTNSMLTGYSEECGLCKWSNCLYIHFKKSDFPYFNYPKENNYYDSSFTQVDFHWGITFYEETIVNGITYVKIGCDYQHLNDEYTYGQHDNGELIIKNDADSAVYSFIRLHKQLAQSTAKKEG